MNQMLYDVMKDAIKKMEGEPVPELLFFVICKMLEYKKSVDKEGLLFLEDTYEKDDDIPEFEKIFSIPIGVQLTVEGTSEEHLTEVLVAKYWANNPQGIYAIANYIGIRTALAYQDTEINWRVLEDLLIAYLPEGSKERYGEYKSEHFPHLVIPKRTPKEEILSKEPDEFDEKAGYIATVKEKLEKEIMDTPINILKQMIEVNDGLRFPYTLRHIHNEVKEKLFSCMTEEKIEELCECAVCTGPVRISDLMDAFTCMLLELMEYKRNVTQN